MGDTKEGLLAYLGLAPVSTILELSKRTSKRLAFKSRTQFLLENMEELKNQHVQKVNLEKKSRRQTNVKGIKRRIPTLNYDGDDDESEQEDNAGFIKISSRMCKMVIRDLHFECKAAEMERKQELAAKGSQLILDPNFATNSKPKDGLIINSIGASETNFKDSAKQGEEIIENRTEIGPTVGKNTSNNSRVLRSKKRHLQDDVQDFKGFEEANSYDMERGILETLIAFEDIQRTIPDLNGFKPIIDSIPLFRNNKDKGSMSIPDSMKLWKKLYTTEEVQHTPYIARDLQDGDEEDFYGFEEANSYDFQMEKGVLETLIAFEDIQNIIPDLNGFKGIMNAIPLFRNTKDKESMSIPDSMKLWKSLIIAEEELATPMIKSCLSSDDAPNKELIDDDKKPELVQDNVIKVTCDVEVQTIHNPEGATSEDTKNLRLIIKDQDQSKKETLLHDTGTQADNNNNNSAKEVQTSIKSFLEPLELANKDKRYVDSCTQTESRNFRDAEVQASVKQHDKYSQTDSCSLKDAEVEVIAVSNDMEVQTEGVTPYYAGTVLKKMHDHIGQGTIEGNPQYLNCLVQILLDSIENKKLHMIEDRQDYFNKNRDKIGRILQVASAWIMEQRNQLKESANAGQLINEFYVLLRDFELTEMTKQKCGSDATYFLDILINFGACQQMKKNLNDCS